MHRRTLIALALATPAAALAQGETPLAFLQKLYAPYMAGGSKGQPYWEAERFFAPDLAQAIERDFAEAKKRNEVPQLDGDPFVDAQDWEIADLTIRAAESGERAQGIVSFLNQRRQKTMVIELVKTPAGWRISEIGAPSGSLRALYKLK